MNSCRVHDKNRALPECDPDLIGRTEGKANPRQGSLWQAGCIKIFYTFSIKTEKFLYTLAAFQKSEGTNTSFF
jgi:hypothetical protein